MRVFVCGAGWRDRSLYPVCFCSLNKVRVTEQRSAQQVEDGHRRYVFVCVYNSPVSVLTPQNGSRLRIILEIKKNSIFRGRADAAQGRSAARCRV